MKLLGSCSHTLAGLLQIHGILATNDDGIVTIPGYPDYKLALDIYSNDQEDMVILEAIFLMGEEKVIRESLGGTGLTQADAILDALYNFVNCAFHVWLSSLLGKPNEHVTVKNWMMNGVLRQATISSVSWRGSDIGANDLSWQEAWLKAVQSMEFPDGLHWINIFYGQINGEVVSFEVLLDNERCDTLIDLMSSFNWVKSAGLYTVRQFMILS